MESRQKKRLGDMLIEEQIITDEQLSDALEKKKGTTKRLGEVLVELGYTCLLYTSWTRRAGSAAVSAVPPCRKR